MNSKILELKQRLLPQISLGNLICELLDCQEVDIDEDGDVWVANPQTGHWLSDGDLKNILKYVTWRLQ